MSTYNPLFRSVKALKEIVQSTGSMGYRLLFPQFEEQEFIEKQVEDMEQTNQVSHLLDTDS